MTRKVTTFFMIAITGLALAGKPAQAQVDVNLAFDPDHCAVGDAVTFSGSLDIAPAAAGTVEVELEAELNGNKVKREFVIPVGTPGFSGSFSVPFVAPQPGELEIEVSVHSGGYHDNAHAK